MALDVDDLDLRNRRAKVRRKGGAVDVIVWRTPTARLLPRLLNARRAGPLFLTTGAPASNCRRLTSTPAPAGPGRPILGSPSCSRGPPWSCPEARTR